MLGRMLEEGEEKDRRQDEHVQKMPLISPMSVIKSLPCCLPQFPLVSAEDEHVHLARNKLESGPKEPRWSCFLAGGHCWVENRSRSLISLCSCLGNVCACTIAVSEGTGWAGAIGDGRAEDAWWAQLSSALQRGGSWQAGERGCRQTGSCRCSKNGHWEPSAPSLVAQPSCCRACGLCNLCAFPGSHHRCSRWSGGLCRDSSRGRARGVAHLT